MASFSLNQVVTSLQTQFPQLFPVGSGIRSHFPTSKPISITALQRFVFRRGPINQSVGGVSTSATVEANGAGGWSLSADATEGFEFFNQTWTVAFVFTRSDNNVGHGQSVSGVLGGVAGGSADPHKFAFGEDPWIKANWPDLFAGDIKMSLTDTDQDVAVQLGELGAVAGFITFVLLTA
jgi:hypothetical protein